MKVFEKEVVDYNVKWLIENCSSYCIPELAKQLRLDNKLTDKYIKLLIEKCGYGGSYKLFW